MTYQEKFEQFIRAEGVPFEKKFIPQGNANRPGIKLNGGTPDWFVWHETANKSVGADADMHAAFLRNGGGASNVSFQFGVDSTEIIQYLPLDEVAWQAGDGYYGEGNRDGLATELCVNADGDFNLTMKHGGALGRALMATFGRPATRNKQHNYFSSYQKNCPTTMRANGEALWRKFLVELSKPVAGGAAPPTPIVLPAPPPQQAQARWYYETKVSIGGAILQHFDKLGGVTRYGLPITGEIGNVILEDGRAWTVQFFERGLLHWRAGEPVGEARDGWMLLQELRKDGVIAA